LDAAHCFSGSIACFFKSCTGLFDFLAANFARAISFSGWTIRPVTFLRRALGRPIFARSLLVADAWIGSILLFAVRLRQGWPEGEAKAADPQHGCQAEAR